MSGQFLINAINNEADLLAAEKEMNTLWKCRPKSIEADKLKVLSILIADYNRGPDQDVDPITAIKLAMKDFKYTAKDLMPYIGTRSRVSEILGRRRPLTLEMIRELRGALGIDYNILVKSYPLIKPKTQLNRQRFLARFYTNREVKTRPDPEITKQFYSAYKDSRQRGRGVIISYSATHGLIFQVRHSNGICAWYDPQELTATRRK